MHVNFLGGTEEKRPLGRSRHKEDDNIKMDQMIIEWGRLYYVYLALEWDRWQSSVTTVVKFCIQSNAGNFQTS
jgi:hypothetical protein